MSKKLLLHSCCGPCSAAVVPFLQDLFYEATCFFYNPNIHPFKEYKQRLDTMQEFALQTNTPLIIHGKYGLNKFLNKIQNLKEDIFEENIENKKKNKQLRCQQCYKMRLKETTKYAAENNYQFFTTTLLYSVYQDHKEIVDLAKYYAKKYNIQFVYQDFRKFWQQGITMSKQLNLYRQKYCGCIFSEHERYSK